MPSTPNGLPYPASTAAPNVPLDMQLLAEAADAYAGDSGNVTVGPINAWAPASRAAATRRIGMLVVCAGQVSRSSTATLTTTFMDVATIANAKHRPARNTSQICPSSGGPVEVSYSTSGAVQARAMGGSIALAAGGYIELSGVWWGP